MDKDSFEKLMHHLHLELVGAALLPGKTREEVPVKMASHHGAVGSTMVLRTVSALVAEEDWDHWHQPLEGAILLSIGARPATWFTTIPRLDRDPSRMCLLHQA